MKLHNYIIGIFIVFGVIFVSFSETNRVKIPYNKIEKSVKRYLKITDFILKPVDGITEAYSQAQILKIQDSTSVYGYIYVGRVNSCRAGGCSTPNMDADPEFEYFDYFFVTDANGNVLNVKVYNYQATQGHEIMSRGWLKQFVGYNGSQALLYGKDIQAISGATISATTILDDIEKAEALIQTLLKNRNEIL